MASARLVVFALFVAGCQCWSVPSVNQGRRAQYYTQQNDGSYQYGYDTAEGLYQSQQGDPVNEVRGQFGADGGKVEYTAGVGGYVVTSLKKGLSQPTVTRSYFPAHTNAAAVRFATLEELNTPPKPVSDTPEVKAAKASFKAAYDAAAAAAEAAPDVNIITGPAPVVSANAGYSYSAPAVQTAYLAPAVTAIKYSGPAAPLDASGRVDDTAEVKAAKASFQAAYNAAAAAAEAAPDVNIITGTTSIQTPPVSYGAPTTFFTTPADSVYASPPVKNGPTHTISYSSRPAKPVRFATLEELTTLPKPVSDTAEVAAAKQQFRTAYSAAAAAAEAAPDVNIITALPASTVQSGFLRAGLRQVAPAVHTSRLTYGTPARYSRPAAPLDASGRVQDTVEVKAAKASFQAAYNAAAAAAEAAPDVNIITGPAPVVSANTGYSYSAPAVQTAYLAPAVTAVKYSEPVLTLDAYGRVEDTPEVKAAKASFKATYDAAAAAAEAAPDVNIITAPVRSSSSGSSHSYYSGASYKEPASHHGSSRTYNIDGLTVKQLDGVSSHSKYGYSYQ